MLSAKEWCCCRKSTTADSHEENSIPIDRGWAWVVAIASAGLFCLITGTFKCFGIFKIEIERNFEECSEDVILWILSMCSVVSLLSGVFFSWLVSRTSHRTVASIGGSLCSLGLFLTAFSPNCYFMFLSLGLLYSVGAGGAMVVVFSAFADYFCKHRGFAVGIAASGSGLGSLAIPRLLTYLFERYTFRDALICYAGVFLQSLLLAALLRPSSYYKRSITTNSENDEHTIEDEEDEEKFLSNIRAVEQETEGCALPLKKSSSETTLSNESLDSIHTTKPSLLLSNNNKLSSSTAECAQLYGSVYSSLAGPFLSTPALNDLENSNKQLTTATSNTTTDTSSSFRDTSAVANYNWSLWCNAQVLMIGTLVFFAVNSIYLIFTTTPSYAEENGVKVDVVAAIISYTGIAEIFCRMVHGWFADRKIFSALTQICIIMLSCTVAAVVCAFVHGLAGIAVMYSVMSLCGTTIYSLLPIVIIEQIGKESLVTVLGIFYVYQAMAFIISTVVANALHSINGSWQYVFYYISVCYFIALVIGVVSFISYKFKLRRRRENNQVIAALS